MEKVSRGGRAGGRRRWLASGLALLLVLQAGGCAAPAEPQAQARPVLVVQALDGRAAAEVYPGEVRARHETALAFRVGGEVRVRHVEVGGAVAPGALLAELDPRDARLQLEAGRARVAAAEAALALARGERDRYRALAGRQLVSRSAADGAEAAHDSAAAALRQARAELDSLEHQDSHTRLRAPAAGVIAARLAEAGQVVAAGQTVFLLAHDGEREVRIDVPEQAREAFAPGRALEVELWSRPGKRVAGRVRERAPAADPAARTYEVRVTFDADAAGAELGQSARVHATRPGAALRVPMRAVTAEDGRSFVWRLDPESGRIERRDVRLGAYGVDSAEILDGIGATDWIVATGVHLLHEGQRVAPLDRENRPVAFATGH